MSQQLSLLQPATVTIVTVCWECGESVASITITADGERWDIAEKWGYVALKAHERERHPEKGKPYV